MKPKKTTRPDGTQYDGPTITWSNGTQIWLLDGKQKNYPRRYHRTDGPACIRPDGTEEWYLNGFLHRTDGPAIIRPDGTQEWHLNGKELSQDLFLKLTQGPISDLPLYIGLGFNEFIAERLQNET